MTPKFYIEKPITPVCITICFSVCILVVVLGYTWVMYYDLHTSQQKYILALAKSKQVPQLSIGIAEYIHISKGEITIVSGVTNANN